jgi:hypothetical protein
MTLKSIRDFGPCKEGWEKLLRHLGYANGSFDPERRVSLGDIAISNDAADALWCVRCLNWKDVEIRRAIIGGVVLPAAKRASVHATDKRVHDCISMIEKWLDGDEQVNLHDAANAAGYAAAAAYAAVDSASAGSASYTAAAAYATAAYAAPTNAAAQAAAAAAADVAYAAHSSANVADAHSAAAHAAVFAVTERERQKQDLISLSPPLEMHDASRNSLRASRLSR